MDAREAEGRALRVCDHRRAGDLFHLAGGSQRLASRPRRVSHRLVHIGDGHVADPLRSLPVADGLMATIPATRCVPRRAIA